VADLIVLSFVVGIVGAAAVALFPKPIQWQSDASDQESETR
jgi:hypothetical protein